MNFEYTVDFDGYFLVIFKIEGIPFAGMVDKESKEVIDIFCLTSGNYNASHPYDTNTSLKNIDWLPVGYYEIEEVLKEYFNANY